MNKLNFLKPDRQNLSTFLYIGSFLWVFGFLFESIADYQKRKFRSENKNKFIQSGLWSVSRHPNYFGEIVLWFGIALIAFPTLVGPQYVSLISPLFVSLCWFFFFMLLLLFFLFFFYYLIILEKERK